MGGMKKEEVRARFAAFWSDYITAVNPDTYHPPDIRNPASLAWHDVRNTAELARYVRKSISDPHTVCSRVLPAGKQGC